VDEEEVIKKEAVKLDHIDFDYTEEKLKRILDGQNE
jgi:hypothetical protein